MSYGCSPACSAQNCGEPPQVRRLCHALWVRVVTYAHKNSPRMPRDIGRLLGNRELLLPLIDHTTGRTKQKSPRSGIATRAEGLESEPIRRRTSVAHVSPLASGNANAAGYATTARLGHC